MPNQRPLWQRLTHWLKSTVIGEKVLSWGVSQQLKAASSPLFIPAAATDQLKKEWRRLLSSQASPAQGIATSQEEQAILMKLRHKTEAANRNNVTRTAAYLRIYQAHPELHWALLAHMVSRNGGWCMTDLKGELIPHLLGEAARRDLFLFLERANALIFQDAYPQLLLYEESKRLGRPLFHLLPRFSVSMFMRPVWEQFWRDRHSPLLTICLIINEQNYIDGRVVQNGYYQKNVLDTLAFQTQARLQLNQVFFPYRLRRDSDHRLAGLVLEDFKNLDERIGIGKALYGLLFGNEEIFSGAMLFAASQPHTGSRSDYNPHLYTPIKKALPYTKYTERLDGCGLKSGASPLYSPPLIQAWKDHPIDPIERYDWFGSLECVRWLSPTITAPAVTDLTGEVCLGLHKIELAILAAQAIGVAPESD